MESKKRYQAGTGRLSGRLFLAWALGAVGLVFVAILLSLAAMDFRTLDMTLTTYVEKQEFDFI
ncbi:MAG: hypothetical protein LJE96_11750 [Deltaproteobacteria bacterium]|nr:hypothetical protein [Deltaproteobacteria bacterium]